MSIDEPIKFVYAFSRYDRNGNLTIDIENSLSYQYNYLNLLSRVGRYNNSGLASSIVPKYLATYTWLADGTKAAVTGGTATGSFAGGKEYLGSLIYTRTADDSLRLESAAFGAGRFSVAEVAGGSGSGSGSGEVEQVATPNYFITDHLGSTRVVFNIDGESSEGGGSGSGGSSGSGIMAMRLPIKPLQPEVPDDPLDPGDIYDKLEDIYDRKPFNRTKALDFLRSLIIRREKENNK